MGHEHAGLRAVSPTRLVSDSFWCIIAHFLADFGEAEKQFQRILSVDPYRIDNIDIYSDILYVTDNRIKLSKLAHEYLELDKDRPEICCLVGKYRTYFFFSGLTYD
jgi:hypothetical protein